MRRLLILAAPLLLAGAALAAVPSVEDVTLTQRTDGSGYVDIGYTLIDADGDTCAVSVRASEDGGLTWHLPCSLLTGDVGPGVAPGAGRSIRWDFRGDNPDFVGDGFRVEVLASDAGVVRPAHSPARYATMHLATPDWNDQVFVEEMARFDLVGVTASELWSADGEASGFVGRLKEANPDVVIVGYNSVKTVRQGWGTYPAGSYQRTLYDALLPYWCWTTTGDTLMDWPGVVNVNILDPDCRAIIIDTFVQWQTGAVNRLDGVYWDYFSPGIWIPDFVSCEGEADMDEDGVPQGEDPDEIEAYRQACTSMVKDLRDALGQDFIQICNGRTAREDSAFAALVDGVHYEFYPTQTFGQTEALRRSLDPAVPNSIPHVLDWLRTEAGGPYVLLENHHQYFYYDDQHRPTSLEPGDQFRIVSLFFDHVYPVWGLGGEQQMLWPEVVYDLGDPLEPTQVEGDVYTRRYRYGDVRMVLDDGGWPDPFDYEVRVNGRLVQSLALPYHFP